MTISRFAPGRRSVPARTPLVVAALAAALSLTLPAAGAAQQPDPRAALTPGWMDAGSAISNLRVVSSHPRPEGFVDPNALGNILLANSDMAFRNSTMYLGNFTGFQIYDMSNPAQPRLQKAFLCPGGQGDVSIYRNLLFMSVEMPNGRVDCAEGGMTMEPSGERFLGVRIFDVSDAANPRQVGFVQTCRGSHTHTLVPHPSDADRVYIYVSGTSGVRSAAELPGCSGGTPDQNPETALFRIEVIEVPVNAPQNARVVNAPRIFADAQSGAISGLWAGGSHGEGTQNTARTDQCHDITAYPAIGLAAGACSGNGILLDISDPANPRRIDEVMDPNFAYWHSATFNNDGSKVIFTDEWGGGMQARCRASDRPEWGANALFTLADGELTQRSYYKLPVAQTAAENCVAHNGSLIPVPGRDIMVQAWYQGGISIFDFTDIANPVEIAYFDRGPLGTQLMLGGFWSAYWYNGLIYASDIARGFDILELTPSPHLTQNEIDAAKLVRYETFNPQTQPRVTWPAHVSVARAYVDQLRRGNAVPAERLDAVSRAIDAAERQTGAQRTAGFVGVADMAAGLEAGTDGVARERVRSLTSTLRALAGS